MNRIASAVFAALLAFGGTVSAQSISCPTFQYGITLTPGQWQACFDAKQNALGFVPVNKAGDTMLGRLITAPPTANLSGFNLTPGSTPSAPANGDLWAETMGLYVRINGATIGPLTGGTSGSFAATAPLSVTFPAGVVTYALTTDANFSVVANQLALATGGVSYNSPTGGAKGAGTINLSGNFYVQGTPVAPVVNGASGTILRSTGTTTAPTYTTATYPATTTINRILYSSAANTIGEITSVNNALLTTGATGVPAFTTTPSIGASGTLGTLTFGNATSGTITLTPVTGALGTISINIPATAGTIAVTAAAPLNINSGGGISIVGLAGGVLAGSTPAFTATPVLGASGTVGSLGFGNATSGIVTLNTVTGALGTVTVSLPAASGTVAVSATSPLTLNATTGALTVTTGTLSKTDDTNVTLTLGGTPTNALFNAVSLTLGWTGQCAVTRGCLGLSSVAQGDIPYGSGANTYTVLAKNTSETRYLSNTGSSNNPAWAQVVMTTGVSDYAEGTWSPILAGSTTPGTQTYSVQSGYYVRIGNFVNVWGFIVLSAKGGTTAGSMTISNLPFTVSNLSQFNPTAAFSVTNNWDLNVAGGCYWMSGFANTNTTVLNIYENCDNGASVPLTDVDFGATSALNFSMTYRIN